MARLVRTLLARLNALVALENEAVAAIATASKRADALADKVRLGELIAMHRRHAAELGAIAREYGEAKEADVPKGVAEALARISAELRDARLALALHDERFPR
jgi:hypothetical protein